MPIKVRARMDLAAAAWADQAFLRDRSDQPAGAVEQAATREAATAGGGWAVGCVKQPVIGAEWPMEPQCVVEAGGLDVAIENAAPMGKKRGIEQRHVGSVGKHGAVDVIFVGKRMGRPDPGLLKRIKRIATDIVPDVNRAQLERALLLPIGADMLRCVIEEQRLQFAFTRQVVR